MSDLDANIYGVIDCDEFDNLFKEQRYHHISLVVRTANEELDWTSSGQQKGKFKTVPYPIHLKDLETILRSTNLIK